MSIYLQSLANGCLEHLIRNKKRVSCCKSLYKITTNYLPLNTSSMHRYSTFRDYHVVLTWLPSLQWNIYVKKINKIPDHVSAIYSILTSIMDKWPYIVKWEEDLVEDLQRYKLVQRASKSLIKTSMNKANYKILLRWYMVPTKLASYVPGASLSALGVGDRRAQAPHLVVMA